MIRPVCDKCGHELTELGGLAFSPPDEHGTVSKIHICAPCWVPFERWLEPAVGSTEGSASNE